MSGIFGSSGGSSFPSFDFSVLSGYYLAQAQLRALQSAATAPHATTTSRAADSGLAPWSAAPAGASTRLAQAMTATSFVDVRDSAFDKVGVSADVKKLFALYTGLTKLQTLAEKSANDTTQAGERSGLDRRFKSGIDEIKAFVTGQGFDDLTLLFANRAKQVDSGLAIPRPGTVYSGNPIVQGASSDAIPGLAGNEVFNISVTKASGTFDVAIDLSQISGALSVDNVIDYVNQQMQTAGLSTRFTRDVVDGATATSPKRYGIAVQSVATEKLSFSAAATSPSLYVAGVSGSGTSQTGQLVKLTDQGVSVAKNFEAQIAAKRGSADARGSAVDAQGNAYVVGTVSGDLGQGIVQGNQDVYLRKYDSAGQLVWSRLLGSSTRADGFGVAVDSSGNVAIAGRVTDRLNSTATGGGNDSFVSKFDSQGNEIFTRQIAPVLDDQANSLAFGADGSLYVAGQTDGAIASGATSLGGKDAYLQKLTAQGALVYTRQLGTAGDDRASAVSVDGDGKVVLASVESGDGVVRKYSPDDGTSAAIWELNLGNLGAGTIGGIALKAGAVYVSGATTNAALTAGGQATIAVPSAGGSDGFVIKIADTGATASASFVTYVGTSGSDNAANVVVNGNDIYVAGATNGAFDGGAAPSGLNSFVAKLDDSGARIWTHQYAGSGGVSAARALAIDPQGSSVLDTLGLPRGAMTFEPSRQITTQSSVRAGDYFYLKVNGGDARKITVKAGDTLRSLATQITSALAFKGTATVTRGGKGDELTIAANDGAIIELQRGAKSFDALAGLGIEPGKLYNTTSVQPAAGTTTKDKHVYALGLSPTMSLTKASDARLSAATISSALNAVRQAYQALTAPPATANTVVPANLLSQLLSYQTALGALGGSGG